MGGWPVLGRDESALAEETAKPSITVAAKQAHNSLPREREAPGPADVAGNRDAMYERTASGQDRNQP